MVEWRFHPKRLARNQMPLRQQRRKSTTMRSSRTETRIQSQGSLQPLILWLHISRFPQSVREYFRLIMGRARKQPAKPLVSSKDSPPKRKRGRPQKKKLAPPSQSKEKVAKCCVCLDTTRYRKMKSLQCTHSFHEQCINKWLETNKKCPLCRMSLGQEDAKKQMNESNDNDQATQYERFYVPSDRINRMMLIIMRIFSD
ncbi:hypothetical protein AVEN_74527-1 [Araneus ventricosus]|uniref:RING-type E3 ubiquitin transferase n=1 Tax=Araneus ventricosus TaxID=182803 RepID=A0A4Y2GSR6_ARAVE|nr:hypothetical protein AVEN_74527-1 [Araneus ventricosus]